MTCRQFCRLFSVICVVASTAACQEPNSAPAATAGPTLTEMTVQDNRLPLAADHLCNLERAGKKVFNASVPFTPSDPHAVEFSGWAGDDVTKRLPDNLTLRLRLSGTSRAWEIPLSLSVKRTDVAKAFNAPQLEQSGFNATMDTSALPPGVYRVLLVHKRDGQRLVCDNGRSLQVKG